VAREQKTGFAVWITGLPASGKSAITAALVEELARQGARATVLESDVLRKAFASQSHYDEQEREYFYRSLAFIGQVLTEHGMNVIFDATANRRSYRDRARQQIPRFLEIHVDTPLNICIDRDPKGIYRQGKAGLSKNVPGLQVEYEPPLHPDLVIHGDREVPRHAAERIIQLLEAQGLIRSAR
jgi:adenylylsulfate kinase